MIVSTPPPKVFWYKNNIPIGETDDDRIQIKHYGDVFKLILKNVNMRDFFGEYKVRAENVAGECQSTCTVHINQPSMTNEKVDNVFSRAVRKAQRVQFGTVLIDLPWKYVITTYTVRKCI